VGYHQDRVLVARGNT